jgi:hypothetical protein
VCGWLLGGGAPAVRLCPGLWSLLRLLLRLLGLRLLGLQLRLVSCPSARKRLPQVLCKAAASAACAGAAVPAALQAAVASHKHRRGRLGPQRARRPGGRGVVLR